MKKALFFICFTITALKLCGQSTNRVPDIFPKGTILYENLPYANDTLQNHLLDIYLPPTHKDKYPIVIWIHGGGWRKGDKYSAMDNMDNTVKELIKKDYAIISINYRYSTIVKFPAQIRDCNQAVEFVYQHATQYHLDKNKIALMGFSAGGHLAALLGLSNNNKVNSFYMNHEDFHFKIKLVIDYYGINDLTALKGPGATDPHAGVALLLGASAADRPDLAKIASPVTYIDKDDPPFLIIHGDKDEAVDFSQSTLLHLRLNASTVKNELMIIPNAPHAGEMFDAKLIREKVFKYLQLYLE